MPADASAAPAHRSGTVWKVLLALLVLVLAIAAGWVAMPRTAHARAFDPAAVARAEAQLWRAYYERRTADLAAGLMLQEHDLFGISPADSARSAAAAARAAQVFQSSRSRGEAQAALPHLVEHFRIFIGAAGLEADPGEAARTELEWWQKRREVEGFEPYVPDIARAAAALYGGAEERYLGYARLRAEAMDLRDRRGGDISADDWAAIEDLLARAYAELLAAVAA